VFINQLNAQQSLSPFSQEKYEKFLVSLGESSAKSEPTALIGIGKEIDVLLQQDTLLFVMANIEYCRALKSPISIDDKHMEQLYSIFVQRIHILDLLSDKKPSLAIEYTNTLNSLNAYHRIAPNACWDTKRGAKYCLKILREAYKNYDESFNEKTDGVLSTSGPDINDEASKKYYAHANLQIGLRILEETLLPFSKKYLKSLYQDAKDKQELIDLINQYLPNNKRVKKALLDF
jgi:hypothetical protein